MLFRSDTVPQEVEMTEDVKTIKIVASAESETVVTVKPPEGHFVETTVTVVEAAPGEQSSAPGPWHQVLDA